MTIKSRLGWFATWSFLLLQASLNAQTVVLQKMQLPATGQLVGISNLFFEKLKNGQVRQPSDWKEVEISPLLQNAALVPIYVIRHKAPNGEAAYVVDTDGDLDFRAEPVLQFKQVGDLKIADVELSVRAPGSNNIDWKVGYQVILSGDGYSYGRVSEYRQGQIAIGDKTYTVILRPGSRNSPQYGLTTNTVCLIDLNQDGKFSEKWSVSDAGQVVPGEEIELFAPFMVGEKRLKVVELDQAGSTLKIAPSVEEASISPGFKAPEFSLKGIDNHPYGLANLKGKIVLLEFWSVSCPFCKQMLPEVNALIKKEAAEDFVALAVAREEDLQEIREHLRKEPRNAIVVANDPFTWQTYNSRGITPTYYLIDPRGLIRLSGYGASSAQLGVVEKLIEDIRKGR
jgi:thiol-disulfide isomerase/thioredoxin